LCDRFQGCYIVPKNCSNGEQCNASYCSDDIGCFYEESEICKLETILIGVGAALLGAGAIAGIVIAAVVCAAGSTTAAVASYNFIENGEFALKNPLFEPATEVMQNPAYGRPSVWDNIKRKLSGKPKDNKVEKSQSGESMKSQSEHSQSQHSQSEKSQSQNDDSN